MEGWNWINHEYCILFLIRYAVPFALMADVVGSITGVAVAYFFFG